MNFSETEQLAVDTFNDLKDQVKAFGLHNFEREDRLLFKQGRELLEQAKKQASQKKTPYTDLEAECLLNAYLLNHADMEKARTVFFREFPNSKHLRASVWQKISRIRTLDNLFPQDTAWDTDLQIRTMCRGIQLLPRREEVRSMRFIMASDLKSRDRRWITYNASGKMIPF